MGVPVKIVAQRAEDQFYKQYKTNSDFFGIDDFIARVGGVLGDYYFNLYREQYAELRSLKGEEIVQFDPLTLNEQILSVEKGDDGQRIAKFKQKVMSFALSNQSVGIQYVYGRALKDKEWVELERSPVGWQLSLMPFVNKVFYQPTKTGLIITSKGNCNVGEVRVQYVPSIDGDDYEVPDVLVEVIIERTVGAMRELSPQVIKKTNDQNQNMIMESEINKNALNSK